MHSCDGKEGSREAKDREFDSYGPRTCGILVTSDDARVREPPSCLTFNIFSFFWTQNHLVLNDPFSTGRFGQY
jgi:hypothetical protein